MKTITKIEATKLAIGMQSILLDIAKEQGREAKYPIRLFEDQIVERKRVSKKDAEKVTEAIINTGIIRWELGSNSFVL